MFKNRNILLKLAIVVSLTCVTGFETKTLAMENFRGINHLFNMFNDNSMGYMKQSRIALDPDFVRGMRGTLSQNLLEKWKADFLASQKEELLLNKKDLDSLVEKKRTERLNRLRFTFEHIILNYFFTRQERDQYKNNHKNDYSLDREFDDLFICRINKCSDGIKFNKEEIFDYLINTYLNMASHYGRLGKVENIFMVVFKNKNKKNEEVEVPENDRQQIKIHFSPQMFKKIYRERYLEGAIKTGKEDCFSSPEDFKKLCFEIRDEKKPEASIYLACSLYDLGKGCRLYGENDGCCDCRVMFEHTENLSRLSEQCNKNQHVDDRSNVNCVTKDFMIVYGWLNVLTKNELFKLEAKHEYIITVYDDAFVKDGKIISLGNALYSEKIKAYSQTVANVFDSAYRNYVAHTKDFDIIFWLKYYFHNLNKQTQNKDQIEDLKAKPTSKDSRHPEYIYDDL